MYDRFSFDRYSINVRCMLELFVVLSIGVRWILDRSSLEYCIFGRWSEEEEVVEVEM